MLLTSQQFMVKYGARTQLHLTNPVVTPSQDTQLPRLSVVHALSYHDDNHFVERSNHYFNNIKEAKKIPIWNVTSLSSTQEVTILANKTVTRDIQDWRRRSLKDFKLVDILEAPNADIQVNSCLNYNLLKGLYTYKSSATASLSKYLNIYTTYWDGVKAAIQANRASEQIVSIEVPTLLPSVSIFDRLVTFKPALFARVVHNADLNSIVQLYKFLDPQLRTSSTMASLTDEDCKSVIIDLNYKGYSFFFRLSDLLSLSKLSSLPSKRKIDIKQLHRFYVTMLLKLQAKVFSLQEPQEQEVDTALQDTSHQGDMDEDDTNELPDPVSGLTEQKKETLANPTEVSETALDDVMVQMSEQDETASMSDDVFNKLIGEAVEHDSQPQDTPDTVEQEGTPSKLQVNYSQEHIEQVLKTKTTDERFEQYVTSAKTSGAISSVEARALKKTFETRKSLKSPFSDRPIDEDKVVTQDDLSITPEETKLHINNPLVDEHHKQDPIGAGDKKYIRKVLNKDIIACITQLEAADIVIKDYQVEPNRTALGGYDVHKITFKPYRGKESTVYFRVPHIDDEGELSASGVRYRLRKQRVDNPLRKISPTRVALTTNYGKTFVFRTDRKSYDRLEQVQDFVKNDYLQGANTIKSVTPGNVFNSKATLPNDYMALSRSFKSFSTDQYTFIFTYKIALENVKQELLTEIDKQGLVFVGYANQSKTALVMDKTNQVLEYPSKQVVGTIPELIGMDTAKLPVQFSMIKVLGDNLALGVVLAYYMGLDNLLAVTQTKFEVLGPRQQHKPTKDEIVIRLVDAKIIVTADTEHKKLLFGGFAFYKDVIKATDLDSMNNKSIYLDIFESRGCTMMQLRELDLLERLFIDPITAGVLRDMNEPTDYLKLLLRANELLEDFKHMDMNDPTLSRIRSYDRVPGLMYRVVAESVRAQKMGMTRGKVELDPYKVWNTIVQDTTVKITEDSNPVTDLKEMEAVTFGGVDGLEKGSTPEVMRSFHAKDRGLISEATVDSGDVGLNFYLTPIPKIKDLRGTVSDTHTPPEASFSTSVMLVPMGEYDDQLVRPCSNIRI